MIDLSHPESQVYSVSNFKDLVSAPFQGEVNANCWKRNLTGDFAEIVEKIEINNNITILTPEELLSLQLSKQGQLAREILLNDLKLLTAHGASPVLNLIKYYERDDSFPFLPTDVYSFHVDRSPVPTDTFLCTYHGESSEILPNSQALQKIHIPEIREELKKLYTGSDNHFESFLTEYFFDLHYQSKPNSRTITLGVGHLWRLAVDHPQSQVSPCIHRAPKEKKGGNRLLLIC